MAVKVTNRKGQKVTLLNPSEKARKYADELHNGVRQTNDGYLKFDKSGKPERLSDTQKSFRSGYLKARKDSAACYKSKKRKT